MSQPPPELGLGGAWSCRLGPRVCGGMGARSELLHKRSTRLADELRASHVSKRESQLCLLGRVIPRRARVYRGSGRRRRGAMDRDGGDAGADVGAAPKPRYKTVAELEMELLLGTGDISFPSGSPPP